jgi:two-component system sensor histidine kinase YesM
LGGVGLQNVDERLKLYYGDGYGLTIESTLGKGTKVSEKGICITKK